MLRNSLICVLLASLCALALSLGQSVEADVIDGRYVYERGEDVSAAWADKAIEIASDLGENDQLRYNVSILGEMSASNALAASRVESMSSAVLDLSFAERDEDSDKLDLEAKYAALNLDVNNNGDRWSLTLSNDGDNENDALWLDGEIADQRSGVSDGTRSDRAGEMTGLPKVEELHKRLAKPVAYARLGESNELSGLAHAVDFSSNESTSLPQRMLDPSLCLRSLFLGLAGKSVTLGQALTIETSLSLGTQHAKALSYSIQLTPRKVFGSEDEASCVLCDLVATPASNSFMVGAADVEVQAPRLSGHMLIDIQKGLVANAALSGNYESAQDSEFRVAGKVQITLDLESKERAEK